MAEAKSSGCRRINLLEACPEIVTKDGGTQKDKLKKLRGFLIGKGGNVVNQMERDTHTKIIYQKECVLIKGTDNQILKAETLIREKIEEYTKKLKMVDKVVPINKELKGPVMGKHGRNLGKSLENGTYAYRSHSKIRLRGDDEKVTEGPLSLKNEAAKAKRRQSNQGFKERYYCLVDDVDLHQDVYLQLREYQEDGELDDTELNAKKYFVLNVSSDSMEQLSNGATADTELKYSEIVEKAVQEVLKETKGKDDAQTPNQWVDLWAHFGQVLIYEVDGGDEEEIISLSEAEQRLSTESQSNGKWKTRFREGISEIKSWDFEEDVSCVFTTRFDLSIQTPSHRSLRFKVWFARSDFDGDLHKVALPQDDLQSAIGEVLFTDARTRASCRGWLCTETRQPLKVNVIIPAMPISFRLAIRKGLPYQRCSKKEDEENKLLLEHLGRSSKLDEGKTVFDILDVPLPKGFHASFRRLSRRTVYRHDNLTITVSDEESKKNNKETGPRVTYDFHVRNSSWDESLKTTTWKPEDIAKGIPDFLTKLRTLAKVLSSSKPCSELSSTAQKQNL